MVHTTIVCQVCLSALQEGQKVIVRGEGDRVAFFTPERDLVIRDRVQRAVPPIPAVPASSNVTPFSPALGPVSGVPIPDKVDGRTREGRELKKQQTAELAV